MATHACACLHRGCFEAKRCLALLDADERRAVQADLFGSDYVAWLDAREEALWAEQNKPRGSFRVMDSRAAKRR